MSPTTITARDLLGTTARTVAARPSAYVLIAALCTIPSTLLANAGVATATPGAFNPITSMAILMHLVGVSLAQAAITRLAIGHLADQPASGPAEALGAGFMRLGQVVLTVLLASVPALLGLLLLVVPGVLVWLTVFVAVPVCVVEYLGPIASLRRSAALTKGHRWPLFLAGAAVTLGYLLTFCVHAMVATYGVVTQEDVNAPLSGGARLAITVSNLAGQWYLLVTLSTMSAVFFARVRAMKRGIDPDAIADELRN